MSAATSFATITTTTTILTVLLHFLFLVIVLCIYVNICVCLLLLYFTYPGLINLLIGKFLFVLLLFYYRFFLLLHLFVHFFRFSSLFICNVQFLRCLLSFFCFFFSIRIENSPVAYEGQQFALYLCVNLLTLLFSFLTLGMQFVYFCKMYF